jgi:hypothetical protein
MGGARHTPAPSDATGGGGWAADGSGFSARGATFLLKRRKIGVGAFAIDRISPDADNLSFSVRILVALK